MDRLERLIFYVKESLEREFRRLSDELKAGFAHMNSRFDLQAARLDRQGALIQTGSRWTARMNDWAETVDQALERKDREIAELRRRVDRLESNGNKRSREPGPA